MSFGTRSLALIFFFFSALAPADQRPALWEDLDSAIKQVREVLELPANSPILNEKVEIAGGLVGVMLQQRQQLPALMKYIASEGILESDEIVENLGIIFDRAAGPNAKPEAAQILKKTHFLELALEMGANNFAPADAHTLARAALPPTVLGAIPSPAGGAEFESAGLESMTVPRSFALPTESAPLEAPMGPALENVLESQKSILELRGLTRVDEIEKAVVEHLGTLEAYHDSAKKTQRYVYAAHTFLSSLGMAYLASVAMNYIDWRALTPREVVGSIGGSWAVNRTMYWLIWEQLGLVESMKQVFSFGLFNRLRDSWQRLIFKAPKLALPYVQGAAFDKPVNPAVRSTTYENAALEALMRTEAFGTDKALLDIAFRSMENGQSGRAMRILNFLAKHRGDSGSADIARRVRAALKAKASLEWKVFRRQLLNASLRVTTIGLGVFAINSGAHYFVPSETFTRWRSIAFAIVGVVGSGPILRYLWQHPRKDGLEDVVKGHKDRLIEAFRSVMEVDPNGELVARIAQYRTTATSQKFVTEAALEALEASPRGGISKTMMKMLADEIANTNGPSSRVRPMVEATFRQLRSCHIALQKVVGKIADTAAATPN